MYCSMLTVGHVHQLGSTVPVPMESFPWQPELLQELQYPAVLVREWLLPSSLFLLEYSCETVWNVNTVAWVVKKGLNYYKIPGLAFG